MLLEEINTGRVPVSVSNVQTGQPVEVVMSKRTDEDYVLERRPFWGSGNRFGSPVPAAMMMTMPVTPVRIERTIIRQHEEDERECCSR